MSVPQEALPHVHIDQVGALKRPRFLLEAFERHAKGEATDAALREAQDRSIRELVAKQEDLGFPIVTDGEHRRRVFMQSFSDCVAGFKAAGHRYLESRVPVESRLRKVRNVVLEEFRFTKSVATKLIKVTLLSSDRVLQSFAWENSTGIYANIDAFAADVVRIEREIVRELVAEGCRYVSIDAPSYTTYLDPIAAAPMIERGEDMRANIMRSLKADNAIMEGFPGVTFGIHLCRGGANRPGRYREGSYEAIAEEMFNTLTHHRFLLEYDTERAGGFEPLRFVPKGKMVVLGLVSTKLAQLESADDLKRRIDEAAKYVPLEQLALSAACGFGGAPDAVFNRMSEDDQWRKIELIRKVAADVWG